MKNNSALKRITLDLPKDLHYAIKIKAVDRDTSMRNIMIEALTEKFEKEKRP